MGRFPAMERATEEAARRFKEMLERNVQRAQTYLDDQSARGLLIRRGAAQMQEVVAALETEQALQELRASFQQLAGVLGDELEAMGISAQASTASIEAMQAFVDETVDQLFAALDGDIPSALSQIMEIGTTTALPLESLVEQLAQQLQTSVTLAVFEADTRLMAFDRLVVTQQATDVGFELFLYDGPLPDGIIRPFCRAHAGKVFTLAEIERMDNGAGQPKPVLHNCGGYNCRHYWTPVTPEEARAFGRG